MNASKPDISQYGRYQILGELGRGAMGVVYRAHDPQIDRFVALKVLREDRVTSTDLVQRFFKEAKAIGRLSHPGIVTVYDVGRDHGTIFIAMEFLEGKSLDHVIASGQMAPEAVVDLGIQVADALDYAHDRGIVHRDIKPTNIILGLDGRIKITDFGIAHIEDPSATQQTQAGEILGTPVYMSPEQVMSKPVDGRSDLYSLGVILYELATGRRPFAGDNLASIFRAITQDIPQPPSTLSPNLPEGLSHIIIKSLTKDPEGRFRQGKDMAEALGKCLAAGTPPHTEEVPTERKKRRILPFFAVAVVLAVAGVIFFLTRQDTQDRPRASQGVAAPGGSNAPRRISAGRLTIQSTPIGAQVYIDNDFRGRSPLDLDLPAGKHEVRLSLPDYYEWEAQIQLEAGVETPLSVRLIPMEDSAA